MPLSRPSALSLVSSAAGESFWPSMLIASPLAKQILISVARSGASSGLMVR